MSRWADGDDVSGAPLPDAAQTAARWLEARDHPVVVGDDLDLHQLLQAVVRLLHVALSLRPGRLSGLHRPERHRNLENTSRVKTNVVDTWRTGGSRSCLTLSCISINMDSRPAM